MFTLKFLLKFLRILSQEADPRQIAGGMALGSIAGITPLASLHNLLVLVLVLMLRVNIGAAILSMGVFAVFSYLLDPLFNQIGYFLLVKAAALQPFWTTLYNTPLVPWTNFNNTLTLGSLVFALLLFWPLYFFLAWAIVKYREKVVAHVQKWKIVQMLKASKIYNLYKTYGEYR